MNGSAAKELSNCDLDAKAQSRKACQAVLRLIAEDGLKEGDGLPNQKELGARLSFCANTLSAAVKILSAAGILEARKKAGTKLRSLSPADSPLRVWNIGVALYSEPGGEFASIFQHCLRRELAARLCADFSFFLQPNLPGGEKVSSRGPDDFVGLSDALRRGKLDMVITPTRLVCSALPVYSAPAFDDASDGIRIDNAHWLSSALRGLGARGARRIAFVCREEPSQGHFRDALDAFLKLSSELGVPEPSTVPADYSFEGGVALAKELLAKPGSQRPDALIFSSDVVASGLIEAFSLAGAAARPLLAVQTNKDSSRRFPKEALRYELDVEGLAKEAAQRACAWLLKPVRRPGIDLFKLKPMEP